MTKVVNINSGAAYDVYCGRAGHGEDGYFGNRFKVGTIQLVKGEEVYVATRRQAIMLFQEEFYERLEKDVEYRQRIHGLWGLTLGCFCVPLPCHTDVVAAHLNTFPRKPK